jgi:translation elongation factor EF-4
MVSAKTGLNVEKLLPNIVEQVRFPWLKYLVFGCMR